jgi:hypothetical protein
MANESKAGVAAEVLLRDPSPESFNKVASYLQQQGVTVTSQGAKSLSIRASPSVFERVFQVRLGPAARQETRPGVRDYGPAPGSTLATDGEAVIPPAIAGDVGGVYLQGPAHLL